MAEGLRRPAPTGATRAAAVVGSPIRHSRSPILAAAAFEAAGLDWTFLAFEVPEGGGAAAVAAMRALGLGGLSVTMPLKAEVHDAVDRSSPAAAALGAVNCVAWEGDALVGHNTDGAGLVAALAEEDVAVAGRRCLLLGAGGAARSVAFSLAEAGAAEVVVANRTPERAEAAAALAGPVGRAIGLDGVASAAAGADLVVNATSVGMGAPEGAEGPLPLPAEALRAGQVVVDLVYQPLRTPLLAAAEQAGARPVDGLGMLVHQAALAIEHWTGIRPDVAAMRTAART